MHDFPIAISQPASSLDQYKKLTQHHIAYKRIIVYIMFTV